LLPPFVPTSRPAELASIFPLGVAVDPKTAEILDFIRWDLVASPVPLTAENVPKLPALGASYSTPPRKGISF
jgi:hypothetical protein